MGGSDERSISNRLGDSASAGMLVLLVVRAIAMGGRFVFIVFAASYMLADDFGKFGLLAALSQIIPMFIGLEAHQILLRRIRQSPEDAPDTRRYYAAFALIGAVLTAVIGAAILMSFGWTFAQVALGALILLLEHLGLETFRNLINEHRPTLSVVSVAFRTGVWSLAVPCVFLVGMMDAPWSFEIVLLFWLAGSLCSLLVGWPIGRIFRPTSSDFGLRRWFQATRAVLRLSWVWVVYNASWKAIELGGRFVLVWMVSEAVSGRYTFLSMLASLCYVIQKGVVEPVYYPKLIASYASDHDYKRFRQINLFVIGMGLLASVAGLGANAWFVGAPPPQDELASFFMLYVASACLSLSQSAHYRLYQSHSDKIIMTTALAAGAAGMIVSVAATPFWGLLGTSVGTMVGAALLLVLKSRAANKLTQQAQRHGPA